jgi:hypothetical protein
MDRTSIRNAIATAVLCVAVPFLLHFAWLVADTWVYFYLFLVVPIVTVMLVNCLAAKRFVMRLIILIVSFAIGVLLLMEYYDYAGRRMEPDAYTFWYLYTSISMSVSILLLLLQAAIKKLSQTTK